MGELFSSSRSHELSINTIQNNKTLLHHARNILFIASKLELEFQNVDFNLK
jgi:hypothetical protein